MRTWSDLLEHVPLVGAAPVALLAAVAVVGFVIAALVWRDHTVWRTVCAAAGVAFLLAAAAGVVNTQYAFYDNVAQLLGLPTYPVGVTVPPRDPNAPQPRPPQPTATSDPVPSDQPTATAQPTVSVPTIAPTTSPDPAPTQPPAEQHPDGLVTKLAIPDTQSHFGNFDANVWLPPQYFSDPRAHFPVIILTHGNPGSNNDWLNGSSAAQTGLASAQAGKPVILVFPTVLQNNNTGDSLCVDTQSNGNAETYIVKDVVDAVDKTFRTNSNAKGRAIGGLSMGGFCALNLGLKHPDVFSIALDFAGETVPTPDTLPGGLQQLFGPNWQQQADANNPTKYYTQLDPSKGPAIWMECGASDTTVLQQMQDFAPKLKAKGFTVEFHTTPGAHDFATFGAGFKDAMPWAAARLYS